MPKFPPERARSVDPFSAPGSFGGGGGAARNVGNVGRSEEYRWVDTVYVSGIKSRLGIVMPRRCVA